MATNKKSTKKNSRKHGRRYLKKAARRTIAALLMVTALVVAAIPATPGQAANSGKNDTTIFGFDDNYHKFYFKEVTDGLSLVGVEDTDPLATGKYDVPKSIDTASSIGRGVLNVVAVDTETFKDNNSVSQVNLPDSVKVINDAAFQNCKNLKSIVGAGVETIENDAFRGCESLGKEIVRFSSTLKKIGSYAFYQCKSISSIPSDYVEQYGDYAFAESGLSQTLDIKGPSSGTVTVQSNTFANTSVNAITFADTVTVIEADAFVNCTALATITLPAKITRLDGKAFEGCSGITSYVEIPGTLNTLEAGTFSASNSIPYIKLNNSGTSNNNDIEIKDGAFNDDVKKKTSSFYVEGYRLNQNNPDNHTKAFDYCLSKGIKYKSPDDEWTTSAFTVRASDGKLMDFDYDTYGSAGVFIPKTVSMNNSESLITVQSIDKDAFKRVKSTGSISSIVVPETITSIDDYALNISSLSYVQFDSKDTKLSGDNALPNETIAPSFFVLSMAENDCEPYLYCMNHTIDFKGYGNIDGSKSSPYVIVKGESPYVLYGVAGNTTSEAITTKPSVAEILLPSGIHEISNTIFRGDDTLRRIRMDGIQVINDYEFRACENLNEANLNSTDLRLIGALPFFGTNLTSVSINEFNPYCYSDKEKGIIYAPVSSSDSNLTIVEALENNPSGSYTVPNKIELNGKSVQVTQINDYAFSRNKNLRIFSTEGSNIKKIPAYCFVSANSITDITLGVNVGSIGDGAFQNMRSHSSDNQTPLIRAYNEFINYGEKRSKFDYHTNAKEEPYYFRSKSAKDMTYILCTGDGEDSSDTKDNLIYLGTIDAEKRVSLSQCSIHINNKTKELPSDGTAVSWKAGTSDDGSVCDFYVDYSYVDEDTNKEMKRTLEPGEDYELVIDKTQLTKAQVVPFSITALGQTYTGTKGGASFTIVETGSDNPLSEYMIVIRKESDPKQLTNGKATWTASSSKTKGDFCVVNMNDDTDILLPGKHYEWDPTYFKEEGSQKFTVTGTAGSSYEGGTIIGYANINDGTSDNNLLSQNYEIKPANGILFADYTGKPISLDAVGTNTGVDPYFYVQKKGATGTDDILNPKSDYTWVWDGTNDQGSKTDANTYPFTITGTVGTSYEGTLSGSLTINASSSSSTSSSSSSSKSSGSSSEPPSSLSVNLILNGPDRSAVDNPKNKYSNTFQYWNEGKPKVRYILDKVNGTELTEGTDYKVKGYGTVSPGLGKATGYVQIQFKGSYAKELKSRNEGTIQNFYYDIKKDLSKNTSDDGTKSVTIQVSEATIDSDDNIEATVALTDATTSTDLVKDTDYLQGSFKKTSAHHADVKITGKGDKYVGTYTYNFRMEEKSESSSGGSSSSSSARSSSSSAASGSSSSAGGSGTSGTGGSGGSRGTNSGTTVVNRNYYNSGNGGSVDELEDMLRAAHIDAINGGTADGYQVNITKSDEAEASFREALLRRYGSLDNIRYFSMDIDVKDENGNDIDTTGISVTLTLPLPTSMEAYGTNNRVATVDGAGDLEDLNVQFSTLEGRPCATFVAPHFSPYGFYVDTSNLAIGTLDNTPKTGDPISPKWFISFGLAALSIFLFLKKDPKPQAQAA